MPLLNQITCLLLTAISLNTLGHVARGRGEVRRAAVLYEESLARFEGVGDKRDIAYPLGNLGKAALEGGQPGRATGLHERSLELYEELGDRAGRAFALVNLGDAAMEKGESGRAASLYEAGLSSTGSSATREEPPARSDGSQRNAGRAEAGRGGLPPGSGLVSSQRT